MDGEVSPEVMHVAPSEIHVLRDEKTQTIGQPVTETISELVEALGKPSEIPLVQLALEEARHEPEQTGEIIPAVVLGVEESSIAESGEGESTSAEFSSDEVILFQENAIVDGGESATEAGDEEINTLDEIAHALMEPMGQELVASLLDIFREVEELETATQEGDEVIIFSSQEFQQVEKPYAPVLQVVRTEDSIIIGEQVGQEAKNTEQQEIPQTVEPLKTVASFIEAVSMIEAILQEVPSVSVETQQQVTIEVDEVGVGNAVKQEKPLDVQLDVSEEILTFIDKGRTVLEKIEQKHSNLEPSQENTGGRQRVKIISDQREIIIELTTLKKLIELYKIKDTITQQLIVNENQTAVEELGLHTMSPWLEDHSAFWNIYRLVVLLLASTSERALAIDYLQDPQKYGVHVLHA